MVETVHSAFVKLRRKQELIVEKIHLSLLLLRHVTVDFELALYFVAL